jgi:hypothetical protein
MTIFTACAVDFRQTPLLVTVRIESLVAAIKHSAKCPFILTVDVSLSFLSLGVDAPGDSRPPYVALFRSKEGLTFAEARATALSVLESDVIVRVEDETGFVEWEVEPVLGDGDMWWRHELLNAIF